MLQRYNFSVRLKNRPPLIFRVSPKNASRHPSAKILNLRSVVNTFQDQNKNGCNQTWAKTVAILINERNAKRLIINHLAFSPCGTTRNRTGDTRIFSPLLYQLSYGTIVVLLNCECKGSTFYPTVQTFREVFCKFFFRQCFYRVSMNFLAKSCTY